MQRTSRLIVASFTLAIGAVSTLAGAALSKPTEAQVKFTASGPAGLKIEGSTSTLDVADDAGNVTMTVPLASLHTGIDVRDKHMKEDLEVDKYPTAELSVARSTIKLPAPGEKISGDAPATLKLHGQSRPVSVHYEAKGDGSALAIDAQLHVNMKDVGINVRSYLGVTVKPDVDVSVHFKVAGA